VSSVSPHATQPAATASTNVEPTQLLFISPSSCQPTR
jgi:hypothetical protein